jgi:3-hydroxyisobutyrate dehydrogenase-like beta-hydroxyacid dehydrogenase
MTTAIETVAILAPGDMGHAVAKVLKAGGLRVITCLAGRSERTRALADSAGVVDVGDDRTLVAEADLLLSILVPAQAQALAERFAPTLQAAGKALLYADCNAIAPQTARRVGAIVEAAGGRFVDAGIIGPPPSSGSSGTRVYASGEAVQDFAALRTPGLEIRIVSRQAGDASAVKMCYAALTKGTTAIMTELLVAADRLGVGETLRIELEQSQGAMVERMQTNVPAMVPKAHRWVGEMEEIAKTFREVGLTPLTFEGAAALYAFVAGTPLGQVSPETWRAQRGSFQQVIADLARTAQIQA